MSCVSAPFCAEICTAASPCQTQIASIGQRLSDTSDEKLISVPSTEMVAPTRIWTESAASASEYTTGSVTVVCEAEHAATESTAATTANRSFIGDLVQVQTCASELCRYDTLDWEGPYH